MICFSKLSSLFYQCHPMLVSFHLLPVAPINIMGRISWVKPIRVQLTSIPWLCWCTLHTVRIL